MHEKRSRRLTASKCFLRKQSLSELGIEDRDDKDSCQAPGPGQQPQERQHPRDEPGDTERHGCRALGRHEDQTGCDSQDAEHPGRMIDQPHVEQSDAGGPEPGHARSEEKEIPDEQRDKERDREAEPLDP